MTISKYKNKLVIVVITFLLSSQEILATRKPPAPRGSGGFGDEVVVGGDIDGLLPLFIAITLLYGIWLKYRQKKVYI